MIKKKYLNTNFQFWDRQYYSPNVESFVFRAYSNLFQKYLTHKKEIAILDYGCGEGSSLKYFHKEKKFIPFGVDISKKSILSCKKKLPKFSKNFRVIPQTPRLFDLPKKKFDIIIAIQSLYYLSESDLKKNLKILNNKLNKKGLVFFTMISKKHYYWRDYSDRKKNSMGLTKVDLLKYEDYKKRYDQKNYCHYINFVKSPKDLKKKFNIFKPLNIGEYNIAINDINKSGHHFTFFGQKK